MEEYARLCVRDETHSLPMAPTERLTLGLLGGLGDAIGGYPEAEPVPSTASPELPSGGGAITSMPAARHFAPPPYGRFRRTDG